MSAAAAAAATAAVPLHYNGISSGSSSSGGVARGSTACRSSIKSRGYCWTLSVPAAHEAVLAGTPPWWALLSCYSAVSAEEDDNAQSAHSKLISKGTQNHCARTSIPAAGGRVD